LNTFAMVPVSTVVNIAIAPDITWPSRLPAAGTLGALRQVAPSLMVTIAPQCPVGRPRLNGLTGMCHGLCSRVPARIAKSICQHARALALAATFLTATLWGRPRNRVAATAQSGRTFSYCMLHKPVGFVSQRGEPRFESVYDLVGAAIAAGRIPGVHPPTTLGAVGRLDRWTSGLLLFSNNNVLHRRKSGIVAKRYIVTVCGTWTDQDEPLISLREPYRYQRKDTAMGQEVWTLPAEVSVLKSWCEPVPAEKPSWLGERTSIGIRLVEVRHRQIRRLCSRAGLKLMQLHREAVGPLKLGSLPSGEVRPLTREEEEAICMSYTTSTEAG